MWYTYMLRCADDSLYTGITTDLSRRTDEHNHTNKAAKYTRARRPVMLVYSESCESRSVASMREYELKKLSKKQKVELIQAKNL